MEDFYSVVRYQGLYLKLLFERSLVIKLSLGSRILYGLFSVEKSGQSHIYAEADIL
jgi:hypothetical protein